MNQEGGLRFDFTSTAPPSSGETWREVKKTCSKKHDEVKSKKGF